MNSSYSAFNFAALAPRPTSGVPTYHQGRPNTAYLERYRIRVPRRSKQLA